MALRDYILCKNCKCKLIPDGYDLVRDHLEEKWGDPEANYYTPMLLCPGCVAALERKVEALRSLLSDVTCVAITMLYDTHKQDVLDEFTLDELKEVVRRSEHLQIAKVEHIYRRGFKALAGGEVR